MKNLNNGKPSNIFIISIIYMLLVFQPANQLKAQDKNQLQSDSIAVESSEEQEKSSVLFRSQSTVFENTEVSHPTNTLTIPKDNVPHINMLRTLAAKIPGVEISATNGDPGSTVMVKIRGGGNPLQPAKPLYVLDGVPLYETILSIWDIDTPVDFGNNTLDLNLEEIESITLLKGGLASVVYGNSAINGAIVIETKKPGRLKKGLDISVNSAFVFDKVYQYPDFQHKFGTGIFRAYDTQYGGVTFGPELDAGNTAIQWNSPVDANGNVVPSFLESYPNNLINFFRTGQTYHNNIGITKSGENLGIRLFLGDERNKGAVPNTDLRRNNISTYFRYNPFKSIELASRVTFSKITSGNRISQGRRSTNPVSAAYWVPPEVDINDLKDYWEEGEENIRQLSYSEDMDNPWFIVNENLNGLDRDRVFGFASLKWELFNGLILSGTFSHNRYNENRDIRKAFSTDDFPNGAYGESKYELKESNKIFNLSYNRSFGKFGFFATMGHNLFSSDYSMNYSYSNRLTIPGVYTLGNSYENYLKYGYSEYKREAGNMYLISQINYNNILYADFSIGKEKQNNLELSSKSLGIGVVISNLLDLPHWITYFRGYYNKENSESMPSQLLLSGNAGFFQTDIKPQRRKSSETGADIRFFDNRLGLSVSGYNYSKEDVIFRTTLNSSTGFSSSYISAGSISESGYELMMDMNPVKTKDFSWDLNIVFSKCRVKLDELPEGYNYINLWSEGGIADRANVGEKIGNLFGYSYERVDDPYSTYDGWPKLDENGFPTTQNGYDSQINLGNINPDFTVGVKSLITWKNFSLNTLFDWRQGGVFSSQTMRRMLESGRMNSTISGTDIDTWKDKGGLLWVGGRNSEYGGYEWPSNHPYTDEPGSDASFIPGVYIDNNGNYIENLGDPETTKFIPPILAVIATTWDFAENWTYEASFVKLRELSFTFNLPASLLSSSIIKSASISIIGSNYILWTKAPKGIDPEQAYFIGNGSFKRGMEEFSLPPIASWGFKVNVRI